ncbi:MAG TPA: methyltransferase domain-containing protein [Rhizomicrobium sp.]
MADNAQQIEYWNGDVGARWARLQETMDASLAAISGRLFAFAAVKPGEVVLDVGCGCGTTSLELARAGAKVDGADISVPMLTVARARAKAAALDIDFVEADASSFDFPPDYDLIFSRFGVMFFDAPQMAFANLRKALAPGGRIAFVCWRSAKENDWARVPMEAAKDLVPPQPPADPHAPGPFAFADNVRLAVILTEAGFDTVSIEKLDSTMYMGADLDAAAEQALSIGPLARAATGLDETARDGIRKVVRDALAPYETPDGITPAAACWLVSAS